MSEYDKLREDLVFRKLAKFFRQKTFRGLINALMKSGVMIEVCAGCGRDVKQDCGCPAGTEKCFDDKAIKRFLLKRSKR